MESVFYKNTGFRAKIKKAAPEDGQDRDASISTCAEMPRLKIDPSASVVITELV